MAWLLLASWLVGLAVGLAVSGVLCVCCVLCVVCVVCGVFYVCLVVCGMSQLVRGSPN